MFHLGLPRPSSIKKIHPQVGAPRLNNFLETSIQGTDCSLRQGAKPRKGTYKANVFYIFFLIFRVHVGPYGTIRAHMGPALIWAWPWPLKSGRGSEKTNFFLSNTLFSKIIVFDLQATFSLWKNNVLQVSGRNTLENAHKITSKSKFSTQNVQIPYHLNPALSYSLQVGAPRLKDFLETSIQGISCNANIHAS